MNPAALGCVHAAGHLAGLLAVLAADGEGQRAQPGPGDFFAALDAVTVGPVLDARERVVNSGQRFRLHLDEGEFDVLLDSDLGGLARIEHGVILFRALGANIADLALHFAPDLALTLDQRPLQFVVTGRCGCIRYDNPALLRSGCHDFAAPFLSPFHRAECVSVDPIGSSDLRVTRVRFLRFRTARSSVASLSACGRRGRRRARPVQRRARSPPQPRRRCPGSR